MCEITSSILTSSLTVLVGVSVFVFGQLILKSIIEPIYALKKTIGDIHYSLNFHARSIITPIGREELDIEAQDALRRLSCDLRAQVGMIPYYDFFASKSFIPDKNNALMAATRLMGLSNAVRSDDRTKNLDISNIIGKLLGLPTIE